MSGYSEIMTFEAVLNGLLNTVPDTVDKREGSIIYDALAPAAAELVKLYQELDIILNETFVDTASLLGLIPRCRERGVPIKAATCAVVEGRFTPATLALSEGLRFRCDDQSYVLGEKQSDGVYALTAEEAGSAGNLYSGVLLPVEYVEGLASARIGGVLVPGEDSDTAETLRKRYFDSLNSAAFGGNQADYREKVLLLNGVGGVKVTPHWNGAGTVKLTILNSDYEVPSAALVSAVQTAIDPSGIQGEGLGLAPIGHVVTVVGAQAKTLNLALTVSFADSWTAEDAVSQFRDTLRSYFLELAKAWGDEDALIVRLSQIETRLLALSCLVDVYSVAINGQEENLTLASDEIPVLGMLTITEGET